MHSYNILQTQLDVTPVSTDGILKWRIDGIFQKIDDAISRRQLFVDSSIFQTCMDGHRIWCRFHPNGKTNPAFISLNVHFNFPMHRPFCGRIHYVLVNQSTNQPLQHVIRYCDVTTDNVNSCFGFDEFVDKNILHGESNPYIHDDSICILIHVEQTNEEKFANLEGNIKDAILQTCQRK